MNASPTPNPQQRRVLWLTFGLAALALLLTALAYGRRGTPLPWTTWALPVVLMVNALITMLELPKRWPRAGKLLLLVCIVVALAIIVVQVLNITRRLG